MINGGIDQQIQQLAEANRGTPNKLMQRYQQTQQQGSPDLLSLLALQKLQSEQQAAKRQLEMQMQQQPQTIKEQLESEMLQSTKQDMTSKIEQVQGVLAKKQGDQQKRAQQMGVAPPPAQMGIAQNPAQNMENMARGGIVGFAGPQGSQVTLEDYEGVDLSGATYGQQMTSEYKNIKQKQRDAKLLDQYQDLLSRRGRLNYMEIKELERLQGKFSPETGADGPEPSEAEPPMGPTPGFIAPEESPATPQPETEVGPEFETPATPAQQAPDGAVNPMASLSVPTVSVPNGTFTGIDPADTNVKYDNTGLEIAADAFKKMAETDPDKAREDAYAYSMGKAGYTPEERAGLQGIVQEQRDLEAKRLGDPKKLAFDRLKAGLLAASGTTAGTTARTFGLGSLAQRGRQEEVESTLMDKRNKEIKDQIGKEREIRGIAATAGLEAQKEGVKTAARGIEGILNISTEEAKRLSDNADRLLNTNEANLTASQNAQRMALDAMLSNSRMVFERDIKMLEGARLARKDANDANYQQAMIATTREGNTINAMAKVDTAIGDIVKTIETIRGDYQKLLTDRIALIKDSPLNTDKTPEQIAKEIEQLRKEIETISDISVSNSSRQLQALEARKLQLGGGITITPQP